jgi:hypothetical protein
LNAVEVKSVPIAGGVDLIGQTVGRVVNSPYRWDLNYTLMANKLMEWHASNPAVTVPNEDFPLHTYRNGQNQPPEGGPYALFVVAPDEIASNALAVDSLEFDPMKIRAAMKLGCLAANAELTTKSWTDMAARCDTVAAPASR